MNWRLATPAQAGKMPTLRTPLRKPESYFDWVCVSVVVVVTGAGTVGCCVVVVEVWVALSVPQPVTDTKATAATQARISFAINIFCWFVTLLLYHHEITRTVGHELWGITRPFTCQ